LYLHIALVIPEISICRIKAAEGISTSFKRGAIKSCTVAAESEFKAESRLDMAADSKDAKIKARKP